MTRISFVPQVLLGRNSIKYQGLGGQKGQQLLTRTFTSGSGSGSGSGPGSGKSKVNELDPNKIKGPGGLTMTQIGKLVQESRARDLEHLAKKKQQQQSSSSSTSKGSK